MDNHMMKSYEKPEVQIVLLTPEFTLLSVSNPGSYGENGDGINPGGNSLNW